MKNSPILWRLTKWQEKLVFSLLLMVIMGTPIVNAQESQSGNKSDTLNYSWEKFSFIVGGFLTGLNSDMVIGVEQVGLGVSINLENALGLKTSLLALRSELEYNFGKRGHSTVRFEYFGLYRNASKVLDSELEIGDNIFPVGTEVTSKYDLQIFKADYGYAFFMDKRVKLSFTAGLFIMPISFAASAPGISGESVYFVAPLPVLGLRTNFAITPKIILKQSVEILYLEISSYKGNILDFNSKIEYNPWKHFGFGLGVHSHRMNILGHKEGENLFDFNAYIKTGYTGLLFYGKFYF